MILGKVFNSKAIIVNLESETKDEAFEELIESLIAIHPEINRAKALQAVQEREAKMSTGIMKGIAVPHGKVCAVKNVIGAVGISKSGIDYDALDKAPVNLIFLLLTDPEDHEYHLSVLIRLSQALDSPAFVSAVLEKTTPQEVYDVLCKFDSLLDGTH
jgi:PTS system fructose-specific IIC component/PTS system nitrogen regulatory IIA component